MSQTKKNIVLLGMMGAGKSSVAKKLSENLKNFHFVDLDEEIEKSAQMTISDIFSKYGEEHFRRLETECAKKYLEFNEQIIATGGGIVVKNENLEILRNNGILFYLKAPAEVLFERVKHETHRPLLQNENPLQVLKALLDAREPAYKTADFEIETADKDFNEIVKEIVEKYETR